MSEITNIEVKTRTNNKKLAINTGFLYIRMLVVMAISFYTVRIVFEVLGIEDYGIYNIAGSIVVFFSFLKTTVTSASQRFFSFALGKGDENYLKKLFQTNLFFYGIVSILVLILSETIGLWFVNTQLNIPDTRMTAANWVYQMSIIAFVFSTINVPFESIVTSHEDMSIYAYGSIVEVVLKLLIVYALSILPFDKLACYGVLVTLSQFLVLLFYAFYCKFNYVECQFKIIVDSQIFKSILGYTSWNIIGTLASLFNAQGVNVILNIFYGPAVNGARAIAVQITGISSKFSQNFFTAVRPQLIKLYASNELENMYTLIIRSAKYSYFLIFFIAMPLILEMDYVLKTWLGEIPEFVSLFAKLSIIGVLIDALSSPLITAAQATGNIKKYQITLCIIYLIGVPVTYGIFLINDDPNWAFYISILISIVSLIARLIIVRSLIGLHISVFVKQVVLPTFVVSIVVYPLLVGISLISKFNSAIIGFLLNSSISVVVSTIAILFIGLNRAERGSLFRIIKKKI